MNDVYDSLSPSLSSPAIDAQMVSPSDTASLSNVTRAIYVGGSGDIAVELVSGARVTLGAAAAGVMLPVRATKVLATGTTATRLVGLW